MAEICEVCGDVTRDKTNRYCPRCLTSVRREVRAWAARDNHYEPPKINEAADRTMRDPRTLPHQEIGRDDA